MPDEVRCSIPRARRLSREPRCLLLIMSVRISPTTFVVIARLLFSPPSHYHSCTGPRLPRSLRKIPASRHACLKFPGTGAAIFQGLIKRAGKGATSVPQLTCHRTDARHEIILADCRCRRFPGCGVSDLSAFVL